MAKQNKRKETTAARENEKRKPAKKRGIFKKILLAILLAILAFFGYVSYLVYQEVEALEEVDFIRPSVRPHRVYPELKMPEEEFVSPQTQKEIEELYKDITMIQIPHVFVENFPADWHINSTADKTLFMKIITAHILRTNARILVEKRHLAFLNEKFLNRQPWTREDEAFFQEMLKKYDVFMPKNKEAQLHELVGKIDIIPPSMAVAQAILITDWGQKNQHAPFGEYGWVNNSYEPLQFKTLSEATDSFALQLNSRQQLYLFHELRRKNMPYQYDMILSEALVNQIGLYMDWDKQYTKKLIETYKSGYIRELDHAQFFDEKNVFQMTDD